MNKVSMIATKAFTHRRQKLKPGDPFEASREDAGAFVAIGMAKRQLPKPPELPKVAAKKVAAKKSTAYMRRDMVAESPEPVAQAVGATDVGALSMWSTPAKVPDAD